jgi:hypothetical protein
LIPELAEWLEPISGRRSANPSALPHVPMVG